MERGGYERRGQKRRKENSREQKRKCLNRAYGNSRDPHKIKFQKRIFYQMIPPHSREKTTKKISEPQMTK